MTLDYNHRPSFAERVNEVIDAFRARFAVTVELVETAQENIEFKVPRLLREPA